MNPAGEVVFAVDWHFAKLNPNGTEQWHVEFLGGPFNNELESTYSAPLIDADGNIDLGLGTGKRWTRPWGKVVRSYTPAGALRWEFAVGEGVYTSSPALAPDGTLYIGSMDGSLYAIRDAATPPNSIVSLAVSPTSIVGGGTAQGTVTLQSPAGTDGAEVVLVSPTVAAVVLPATVAVPAGATTATFPIGTAVVSATTSTQVCGQFGGATRCAEITVTPVTVAPDPVTPGKTPRKRRGGIN